MTIEQELFDRYQFDEDMLRAYGFGPEGNRLVFRGPLPEEGFGAELEYDGTLKGRILDHSSGEEYTNFRVLNASGFGAEIRRQYEALLLDIREKCCRNLYFRPGQARRMHEFIHETYGSAPEFLWPNIPTYAAYRAGKNGKWFAVIGSVPRRKLDPASGQSEPVDVVNVKADGGVEALLSQRGYYPAFHMNKKCWVSIILDDTLPDGEIEARIRESRGLI